MRGFYEKIIKKMKKKMGAKKIKIINYHDNQDS